MVDQFSSEQEQLEAIQKWLKTHGPSIIVGIVVGLAAIGGWRYWLSYQEQQAEEAAAYYQTLTEALADDRPNDAAEQVAVLQRDYASSAYATLAAFLLAKRAADEGDNAAATEQLRWVIDNGQQPDLTPIARLRLARLLLADGALDDAKAQLDQVTGSGFSAEREELMGDIHLAAGDTEQARTAYQAALAAAGPGAGSLLELKLDQLPPAS